MPVKLNVEVLQTIPEGELVRDTDVKGLIATRTKTGGLIFKVQHDLRGKTIRMTLRTKDLKEARAEARQIKNQIASGIDPRMPKVEPNPGPETWTVRQAMDRYVAKPDLRDTTRRAIRDHLQYLRPILDARLGSLTKSAVREAHEKIAAKGVRDGAMRYLRAAYNYAAKFDDANRLPPNPTSGVHWGKAKSRPLVTFEIATWAQALPKVSVPRRQFHLLLLTGGLRKSTAWSTTWDMIDLPNRAIRYDAASMKSDRDFNLPLSDYMVELIESIPRLDDKWVFPSPTSKSGHITEADEPALGKAVGHQLRKKHYSIGEALGIAEAHLGALHDHAQPGLKKNYASRLELFDELLKHQQRITDALRSAGLPSPSDIV